MFTIVYYFTINNKIVLLKHFLHPFIMILTYLKFFEKSNSVNLLLKKNLFQFFYLFSLIFFIIGFFSLTKAFATDEANGNTVKRRKVIPQTYEGYKCLTIDMIKDIETELDEYIKAGNDSRSYVYGFDVHGVLTSRADPYREDKFPEIPRTTIISFLTNLINKGATVYISSACTKPELTRESLNIAGLGELLFEKEEILKQNVAHKSCEIMRLGDRVISVKSSDAKNPRFYKNKGIAGIFFIEENKIDVPIKKAYLFDDSVDNLRYFEDDLELFRDNSSEILPKIESIFVHWSSKDQSANLCAPPLHQTEVSKSFDSNSGSESSSDSGSDTDYEQELCLL